MRLLFAVALVMLFAAGAAVGSTTHAPAPAPPVTVVPPPPATPDPEALVPPDASLELDRAFLAALDDRPAGVVRGLELPIVGTALPTDPLLLPYSPRTYRSGVHEGIDFPARFGTPVHAAAAGYVVRVDRVFSDWSLGEQKAALADALKVGRTPAETLDRIRGRQVWIDHGHGIVTRYAHLSAVAPGLQAGDRVAAEDVIGAVGSSGYPEGGPHLHFEVRIGEGYLGEGRSGDELLAVIARAFAPGLPEPGAAGAERRLQDDLDGLGGHGPR